MDQFNDDGSLNDDINFPMVTTGSVVFIQMKDSSYFDATGKQIWSVDRPARLIVHSRESCWMNLADGDTQDEIDRHDVGPDHEHQVTICTDCIDTWARDYYITLGDTPYDLGLRDKPTA